MPKRTKKGAAHRARVAALTADIERAVLTIQQFCKAYGISESFYFKLRNLGRGPRETRLLDRKVVIAREDAELWRQQAAAKADSDVGKIPAEV